MRPLLLIIVLFVSAFFTLDMFAASALPGAADAILQPPSINVSTPANGGDVFETLRDYGLRILNAAKIFVSGFALIYIVILGVSLIVFSENEDKVKSQRRQMSYVLMAFLFLNIPGTIYIIFFGDDFSNPTSKQGLDLGGTNAFDFWDANTLLGGSGFLPSIIGFFEIFVFGVSVMMFTWGLFRLILSAGNEEIQKKAKTRILNGVLGLIFFGFVKVWGSVIAKGDFFGEIPTVGRKLLGLALYFAAPIVVAFLVLAAFYLITSAGDEEKVKKAKSIFVNTLIASIILLGAYSFITDLANFSL